MGSREGLSPDPAFQGEGLPQRLWVDGSWHGLDFRKDFFGEEFEAFLGFVPWHAAVKHVDHYLFKADGPLQRSDPLDDLVRRTDGLGCAPGSETGIRGTDVGSLACQVFLVAVDAFIARVVPFEVVVLGRG